MEHEEFLMLPVNQLVISLHFYIFCSLYLTLTVKKQPTTTKLRILLNYYLFPVVNFINILQEVFEMILL